MNFQTDTTLVVGVDEKYFRQLAVTFPFWLKMWPKLRDIPWVFFYDGKCPALKSSIEQVIEGQRHFDETTLQAWLPPDVNQYEDQRDRMLTAWSLLPPLLVKTRYWLKLDVDAYPVRPIAGSFPLSRWFESNPAIVGHSWGYTKTRGSRKEWFDIFDAWADNTTLMHCDDPLNLQFGDVKRLSHKRIASFIAFFETAFTQQVASECVARDPNWTIPIPSQDTFLWACAARMKKPIVRVRMKRHGWTNQSNFNKLQKAVTELQI